MSIPVPLPSPAGWNRIPAGRLFLRQKRKPSPDEAVVTAFRDGQVTARANRRIEGFTNAVQEIGYQGVRRGDLVIHSMDGFAGAIGVSDSDGKMSPVVHIYTARDNIDAQFFAYMLRTLAHEGFVTSLAKGIRERSTAFDAEAFTSLALPTPPLAIQHAIADYLDRETARIDALIAAKRRMVKLSEEQFAAYRECLLVTGEPVRWIPLQYLTDPSRPVVYGIVQAGEEFPGGVPYIKTGDLPILDPSKLSHTSPKIDEAYRRARVIPGDIVVAMRASIGTAVHIPRVLPIANLTQGTARIAPAKGVDGRWLLHAFRTHAVQEQCSVRAVGTTFKTLNIWDLRRVLIPTPNFAKFSSLVDRMDDRVARHNRMTGALERQVALLEGRRQVLITAAVTGQLDIPGAT